MKIERLTRVQNPAMAAVAKSQAIEVYCLGDRGDIRDERSIAMLEPSDPRFLAVQKMIVEAMSKGSTEHIKAPSLTDGLRLKVMNGDKPVNIVTRLDAIDVDEIHYRFDQHLNLHNLLKNEINRYYAASRARSSTSP